MMTSQFEDIIVRAIQETGRKVKAFYLYPTIDGKNGYLSEILFANFVEETADGLRKQHEIVLKRGDYNMKKCTLSNRLFQNEKYFYETIMSEFRRFHAEHKSDVEFDFIPEYYGSVIADGYCYLIMKNLKKNGYDLWNRTKPMTLKIIKKVLCKYAELHGTSFALKEQNPDLFNKLTSGIIRTHPSIITKLDFKYTYHKNMKKIIEMYKDQPVYYEKLNALGNKLINIWEDKTKNISPYSVIAHGDAWNNNFLLNFKECIQVKILDWQLTQYMSPVYDISYYLFSVASAEELKYFDEMLEVYYDTLEKTVKKLGNDIKKIYTFEQLVGEWKKYSVFDLIETHSLLKVSLCEEDEFPRFDIDGLEEGKVTVIENFLKDLEKPEEYYKRCKDIIDFCIERNYI